MTTDLDTLLTALYVLIDDHVIPSGQRRPGHPRRLSDAELVCLAVAQVPDRAGLIARVADIEAAARQLAAERDARAAEASHAQRQIRELQDDLTAARESLRRAIRQANR